MGKKVTEELVKKHRKALRLLKKVTGSPRDFPALFKLKDVLEELLLARLGIEIVDELKAVVQNKLFGYDSDMALGALWVLGRNYRYLAHSFESYSKSEGFGTATNDHGRAFCGEQAQKVVDKMSADHRMMPQYRFVKGNVKKLMDHFKGEGIDLAEFYRDLVVRHQYSSRL